MKSKIMEILEKNIGLCRYHLEIWKTMLSRIQNPEIENFIYIKIESIFQNAIIWMKTQTTNGKNICILNR